MFFKLLDTEDLSWILHKNPASTYFKTYPKGRSIVGRFHTDVPGYQITINTNIQEFTSDMKAMNEASYVRAEPWIVCPSALKLFYDCLSSAIKGSNTTPLSEDKFFAKRNLTAEIGPLHKDNLIVDIFQELHIKMEVVDELQATAVYKMTTEEPMSVTEFLQKIYIVSLAFTSRFDWNNFISKELAEKYIRLSKNWLEQSSFAPLIVKKLTNYNREYSNYVISNINQKEQKPTIKKIFEDNSLHTKRHDKIISSIRELVNTEETFKVLDLGCSEGKLIAELHSNFSTAEVVGVDALESNKSKIKQNIKRLKMGRDRDSAKIIIENLTQPRRWLAEARNADVIVATEIIEHLEDYERLKLLSYLKNSNCKNVIITVPNYDFNKFFSLEGFRHKDHKIEYTQETLQQEIIDNLSNFFDIQQVNIVDPVEYVTNNKHIENKEKFIDKLTDKDQPSFMLVCKRIKESDYLRDETVDTAFFLEKSGVALKISKGFTDNVFLKNSGNIFYLGPTIAPVEADPFLPYLEHPSTLFSYFKARNITKLIEQPKLMGSRGYLLCFKNEQDAFQMGYKHPVTVNSRAGFKFFDDISILDSIHKELSPKMTQDVWVLDCEILPWSYKAKSMIENSFLIPGEAALLWRKRFGTAQEIQNAEKFLSSLENYSKQEDITIHPFQLLAAADVNKKGDGTINQLKPFNKVSIGYYLNYEDQYTKVLDKVEGNIIKRVPYHVIDINDPEQCQASIARWEEYCDNGGEGFVYKPYQLGYAENGFMHQPAIKVRGREYLRIIYGIDYLEKEVLEKLKQRKIKNKRLLATQEHEIAMKILHAFTANQNQFRLQAIAAFLSHDRAVGSALDQTL